MEINPGDLVPTCACQLCKGAGERDGRACWLCEGKRIIPVVIHLRWIADGRRIEEDPW